LTPLRTRAAAWAESADKVMHAALRIDKTTIPPSDGPSREL